MFEVMKGLIFEEAKYPELMLILHVLINSVLSYTTLFLLFPF
jgi:hypothetical protein